MATKTKDPLSELADLGDDFGMETGAWEYPTIGYNASDGLFYVGEDTVSELDIVILAVRRCKEVTDNDGVIWRYQPYHKRHLMREGDVAQRLQAVVLVDNELHLFGAKSWTARALFDNAAEGSKYHDGNYQPGLWQVMVDWIKKVKAERGVATSPYCWRVNIKAGKPYSNPQDRRRQITPIVYEGPPFTFVGKEQAAANKALIEAENLKAWQDEWHRAGGVEAETASDVEPGAIGTQEDSLDDIPGFDL